MMRRNEPREKVEPVSSTSPPSSRRQAVRSASGTRRPRSEKRSREAERIEGALTLDPKLGARNADLNARMRKALDDDFGTEYRDMIRRYFESVIGDER